MTDKLIEFIYQLSVEDIKVAVRTLKEPICFVKRDRGKHLTLSVMIIKLDNNSWINIQILIDSGCTRFCIN